MRPLDRREADPSQPICAPGEKPAVLFFDDFGYEQFDQLALCLRRRGLASIRLTSGKSRVKRGFLGTFTRWLRDRCIYNRCLSLDSGKAVRLVDQGRIGDYRIMDVLMAETAAAAVGLDDPRLHAMARHSLAFAGEAPARLLDKFEVNALLARAGLPVPAQISADKMGAAAASRMLGLPLAVKGRVGLGGDGVRIARTVFAVDQASRELSARDRRGVFFQAFVPGATVGYGCVRGPEGPLIEHGFRIGATQWDCGPSAKVWVDDDPHLLAAGRRAVQALGCQGLAQIDLIQDENGRFWPIDANLRPWGNVTSLLCLDIDFAEAYASLLLGEPHSLPLRPAAAASRPEADVFPFALYEAARGGRVALLAVLLGRFARMCRRGPGAFYETVVIAKTAVLLAHRLARRGRDLFLSLLFLKFAPAAPTDPGGGRPL
jgi:hypothetical protein